MRPAFLPAAKEETVVAVITQVPQLLITRQSEQGVATTHAERISSGDGWHGGSFPHRCLPPFPVLGRTSGHVYSGLDTWPLRKTDLPKLGNL